MPEIYSGEGDDGRFGLRFTLLKGERPKHFERCHAVVDTAMNYIKSSKRSESPISASGYKQRAVDKLVEILPRNIAEHLVWAVLNKKTSKKAVLRLRGEKESEGFIVELGTEPPKEI